MPFYDAHLHRDRNIRAYRSETDECMIWARSVDTDRGELIEYVPSSDGDKVETEEIEGEELRVLKLRLRVGNFYVKDLETGEINPEV